MPESEKIKLKAENPLEIQAKEEDYLSQQLEETYKQLKEKQAQKENNNKE